MGSEMCIRDSLCAAPTAMLARLVALAAAAGASKIFGAAPGAPDSIMDDSSGTYCVGPVQEQLRWNVDQDLAERIACHNRRYAERAGYWRGDDLTFLAEAAEAEGPVYVYDADLYPFFVGEMYHQFHKNTVTGRYVEDEYLVDARAAAKDRGWIYEVCSEPGSSGASNLGECSTGLPDAFAIAEEDLGGLFVGDAPVSDFAQAAKDQWQGKDDDGKRTWA